MFSIFLRRVVAGPGGCGPGLGPWVTQSGTKGAVILMEILGKVIRTSEATAPAMESDALVQLRVWRLCVLLAEIADTPGNRFGFLM
jgi:hypothetical protein